MTEGTRTKPLVPETDVASVIVTRGNVPESVVSILAWLPPFAERAVWDNYKGTDLAVYGRYAAIDATTAPVIFVQDDDCLLDRAAVAALLAAYEPGHVVCNMPERFRPHYPDSALVGFGAVFDRDLPRLAFQRFAATVPRLGLTNYGWSLPDGEGGRFNRTCDVVFTTLTPRILVDVPVRNMSYATDSDRMYRQPSHLPERRRMLDLARKVRDA